MIPERDRGFQSYSITPGSLDFGSVPRYGFLGNRPCENRAAQ